MPDSSFYAPGTGGGGASNLDGLTDVVLTSPLEGESLVYNGTEWVNFDALNIEHQTLNPVADRYYFTRNQTGLSGLGGYNAFLVPIRFSAAVEINKFIVGLGYNPPTTQGNGGIKIRAYIYNSSGSPQHAPTNLHKDMGYFTIAPSNSGGPAGGPQQFTLATNTVLNADQTYWMGFAYGPVDPNAGNLGNWTVEVPGLVDPWYHFGVPTNIAQYMTGICALYNGSTDWSTFNFETGTLQNNISNSTGFSTTVPRIGIRVNALD
jgi:hypothetical protein